uniref:60S ribosomal protein L27 n=1 Tax=Megaselia scalaris TaxID=36166 RepID=T1GML4_MEGSC
MKQTRLSQALCADPFSYVWKPLLIGGYAGRKSIIVKTYDDGTSDKQFGQALVVSIDRYPRKVTKSMSNTKLKKKFKIKPFLKALNYNHLMPTRYTVSDISLDTPFPNQSQVNANDTKDHS